MRFGRAWIGALCVVLAVAHPASGAAPQADAGDAPRADAGAAPQADAGDAPRADAGAAPSDSAAAEPGGFDAPTWVMARSLVIPGWGQAKNGAWWKAILVAGVEGAFLERLYFEDRRVQDYRERAAVLPEGSERDALESKVRRHIGHRRDFTWWTACVLILSLADAYVDAHLRRFDVRLDGVPSGGEEPGAPPLPAAQPAPDGAIGLRVGLRLAG